MMRTADLVILKPPDTQWMLNTIGYLATPKPIVNRPVFHYEFDNHDNLFDDLPPLSLQMQRGCKLTLLKEAQLR